MKFRIWLVLPSVLALLMLTSTAGARPLATPISAAFTYQGRLTDGGNPANGVYDFVFELYDASEGGFQAGSTLEVGSVPVVDGLFTVQLDIGDVFEGTALWLQIGVAPGGTGGPYITLDPRQPLTATPFALYSAKAPWSGLMGVPSGFADEVDDGSSYQNVVVVAQSGGDFTSIQSALNSISDASSSNRYLVYVAPGVYTEQVTMEPYVDIQGSGELNTRITFTGTASSTTGTLTGANDAELRLLTVENTGGDEYAIAIINGSASPHLAHVTASASGGTENYGVYNNYSSATMMSVAASASGGTFSFGVQNAYSSPTMTNVTAKGSGGGDSAGVFNFQSSPTMMNVTASGSGGTNNYGVYNGAFSGSHTVVVNNSQIIGGTNAIYNYTYFTTRVGASLLSGGAVFASGGTVTCAGVYDEDYVFYADTCP